MTTIASALHRHSVVRLLSALSAVGLLAWQAPVRTTVDAQAQNPIVTENSIPGSPQSEWDVAGMGDPTIQGFATDISVNKGAVVSFKIKLDPAALGYTIDIYRLGYYQGFGARKVGTVSPTAAQLTASKSQPACLKDPSSGLVDCGNWSVSGTLDTTTLTSGVFIARPKRTDTPGASHIVFVVRDDSRTADVLVQTSDATWQAYNQYPGLANGGGSTYCNGPLDNSSGGYSCPNRAAKVSYNRPFDTREHDATSWLFNAEYPMLRWLEANGYDVKYWAAVDTDRFGRDPAMGLTSVHRPKAFLSVGHDEYWSGPQRASVESARDAGVNLAFFSGNEMFWKTRYEPSIDGSGTSYRTLVTYKETFTTTGTRLDPNPANPWTGTWRDTRFSPPLDGGRPENALTGQIWTVNCCATRLTVPASMKDLRFWRNTAVAQLPAGQVYVASPETVGYEWDEDLDNGARPTGLARLSSMTASVPQKVLDFGVNVGPGVATHSLTLYRWTSGALVFGAGTVQWSWGLDGTHDRTVVPPDRAMQQATVNLLADMGAQPATIQLGADGILLQTASMSTDIFAPTSVITSPAAGSSVSSGIRTSITGTATERGGGAVAGVEVSVDGGTKWHSATMTSSTTWSFDWQPGALGPVTLKSRAIDDSGNLESAGPGIGVTVATGNCPCTSLWKPSVTPGTASASDTNPVEVGLKFYSDIDGFITGVRFYKGPLNNSTHVGSLWTINGALLATATFGTETATGWQQVLFGAPVAITAGTTYVVSYHTNVGGYAADGAYFATTGVDSPPLHAAASSVAGGNGLFGYGASQFPTQTFNATNYWVDAVFSPSLADTTPPVVSLIKSTIVDSSRVTITWTTDEPATSKIQYSTDATLLTSTTTVPAGTVTINQSPFVMPHSVALTGLVPNTTYYYRVISVDRSGNPTNVAAPSVTVPGPTLRDTSSPDFAAGASSGTYVSETANGEVILAPVAASEFSGTALSADWIVVPWSAGGKATVGNGGLLVDGSRVGTCAISGGACQELATQSPGHRLDFVATFSGDGYQHAGFGRTLEGAPWAIFSTGTGGTLFARSLSVSGLVANDEIRFGPTYLGQPHLYGIDWQTNSVKFYIDGALVMTHGFAVEGPMRPIAASDFSIFGGNIGVDWIRMSPYPASGTFQSRIFDASASVDWHTIQWAATTPTGTAAGISVRVGDTPIPDGAWTAWQPIAAPGPLTLRSRYIQYQAALSTSDANVTPSLNDIIVSTGRAPVAVNDSIVVPENGVTTVPPTGFGSLVQNDFDLDNDPLTVVAVGPALHASVVVNFDGSVTYRPVANYAGPDSFVYTVSDGLMTSSATVSVDVRFGNIAPVANNDRYAIDEDTLLTVPAAAGVLVNDTDVERDVLSAALVTLPAHGMLTFNSIGSFTYMPVLNYAGPDSFTYKAWDGLAFSNVAIVNIDVRQVNDPPVTEPDFYTAVLNQPLTVAAPGVLANDHDIEVEDTIPLHAQLVSQPANGRLIFNSDGSFVYTPNADFLGVDKFTYASVDHFNAVGNTATVTITVAIKAVSQAINAGGTVLTGTAVTPADPLISAVTPPSLARVSIAQGVIAGSAPPSGYTFLNQQVTITIVNPDGTELLASAANPIRLVFTIDGSLLLPGETADTLQMFRNGVLIPNCLGQPSIPAANLDPCITAREGGPALNNNVRITVLSSHASQWNMGLSSASVGNVPYARNDGLFAVDYQRPLAVSAPGVLGNDYGKGTLTASLVNGSEVGGTVRLNASGAFVFTPGATTCGPASFKYLMADGTSTSLQATVSLVIDCLPKAVDDLATVNEDSGTTTITVLANDSDPDPGQTLTVISVGAPAHGTSALFNGGQAVNYAPEADYFGSDSFTYTISDGRGGTAVATVSITVRPVNDAPSFTKGLDQTVTEDSGPHAIPAWAKAIKAGPANEAGQLVNFLVTNDNSALFVSPPAIAADGTLSFTSAPDANGVANVTVQIHDNGGTDYGGIDTSVAQTFVITVKPVNDPPKFVMGSNQTVLEDAGPQTVNAFLTGISAGPPDEASQTLTVLIDNDNPGLFSAGPSIDPVTGRLTYTPARDKNGVANIAVRLRDNGGTADGGVDTSATGSFTITVTGVNDPPSFTKGLDQTVAEDSGSAVVAVWASAIKAGPADEAGQILDFLVTNSNNALFSAQPSIAPDGTLTFKPADNANGSAIVTVKLHDNGGTLNGGLDTSDPQTFTITVTPVNDAPTAAAKAVSVPRGGSGAITLSGSDIETPAANLSYTVTSPPSRGALSGSGANLVYAANAGSIGTVTFQYTVTDTGDPAGCGAAGPMCAAPLTSAPATVTITITPTQLTITANDATRNYGVANPALSPAYSGFVNGDTPASVTTPPSLATTATQASPVGTYPITASGAVAPDYTIVYVPGTLTVTQAPTSSAVTTSLTPSNYGQLVVFTAKVASVNGYGTPTGTVTFMDGAAPIGTGTLDGTGTAAMSSFMLAAGTHSLKASYGGDSNYAASTSSAIAQTVVAVPIVMLEPTSGLTFPSQDTGRASGAIPVTLTNIGVAPLNIGSVTIVGQDARNFFVASKTCGAVLVAGASCVINVKFRPYETGNLYASLSVTDNDNGISGSTQALALAGTGLSTISANFTSQSIAAGNYIWFNSAFSRVKGPKDDHDIDIDMAGTQVRVFVTNGSISFTVNGVKQTLAVPDAIVTFSPSATQATTSFDAVNKRWLTTVPSVDATSRHQEFDVDGDVFVSGLAYPVGTGGLPGGIKDVTWSASYFTDTPGVNIHWWWGAAPYSTFSSDYNALNVKPTDTVKAPSQWSGTTSPAGTPEAFKQYVKLGATVRKPGDYVGSRSFDKGVLPDVDQVTVTPWSLAFAPQPAGKTSSPIIVTITNNHATWPLVLASLKTSGDFALVPDATGASPCSLTAAITLKGQASCTVGVTFTPVDLGTRTGALTITFAAPPGVDPDDMPRPIKVNLAGNGGA